MTVSSRNRTLAVFSVVVNDLRQLLVAARLGHGRLRMLDEHLAGGVQLDHAQAGRIARVRAESLAVQIDRLHPDRSPIGRLGQDRHVLVDLGVGVFLHRMGAERVLAAAGLRQTPSGWIAKSDSGQTTP